MINIPKLHITQIERTLRIWPETVEADIWLCGTCAGARFGLFSHYRDYYLLEVRDTENVQAIKEFLETFGETK